MELEDLCNFSQGSLAVLFAILTVSGSKALQPVVLTLLIHTISLRLAINARFLHDHPTLSRFIHAIPLLGMSCVAGVALVSDLQSPALAAVYLFVGVLPLVPIIVHQGILCVETYAAESLPVRMQHASVSAVPGSVDTTVA